MRRPVTTEGAIGIGHPLSTGEGAPARYEHKHPCPGYGNYACGSNVSPYSPGPRCWLCERRKQFAEAPPPPPPKRYPRGRSNQVFLDELREQEGTASQIAERLGMSSKRARLRLNRLAEQGFVEILLVRTRGGDGYLYRLVKDEGR